jgi:leucyl-tRNA synthetase
LPTEDGQPPLGNAPVWAWDTVDNQIVDNVNIDHETVFPMELNTMPGWAGSSWYFLRYMDPHNEQEFVSKEKVDYWKNVDLYIGGSEHATGHLLYARFWTKFLYDLGFIGFDEPFQKMINQGMILGNSAYINIVNIEFFKEGSEDSKTKVGADIPWPVSLFISSDLEDLTDTIVENHIKEVTLNNVCEVRIQKFKRTVDINLILGSDELDLFGFKTSSLYGDIDFDLVQFYKNPNDKFLVKREVEKMSKSKFNVQTPDELVEKFGADTLRMYEMFLGPLEQSKPWDTKGINGVHNFLRKFWRLFHDQTGNLLISDEAPSKDSLKTLHKTIQKISIDLERFSFNTGVSNFMIAVNELGEQKCNNRAILKDLLIMLSPYAPHISEELWVKLGYEAGSINVAPFPTFNPEYLVESAFSYPISFNGKVRFSVELPADMSKEDVEAHVLALEKTQHYLEGKAPKKMIVVPGRIVNIVL